METPPTSPVYILPDEEHQDRVLNQYAQGQHEGIDEAGPFHYGFRPQNSEPEIKNSKHKHQKKRCFLRHFHNKQNSFVLKSAPKKGRYLIKIQVIDLESRVPVPEKLLCAQYVVEDDVDPIMDQTEGVISNISKKLCGYSYNFY